MCSLRLGCNAILPGQYYDAETGLSYNDQRDYDPAVGRYVEADPAGQLFYFSLSTMPAVRRLLPPAARLGYWNHLYAYSDSNPASKTDPYGLGFWQWILDHLGEGAQEETQEQTITGILSSGCVAENCKRKVSHRTEAQAYGDCFSILDRITKQQGAAVPGGIQSIGDTNLILSECAEQCSKALEQDACPGCKNGSKP
jgi:RHS repeat-associated protein